MTFGNLSSEEIEEWVDEGTLFLLICNCVNTITFL
jgi:hypothetical protein